MKVGISYTPRIDLHDPALREVARIALPVVVFTVANLVGSTPRSGSMGKPVPLYDVEIQRDDGGRDHRHLDVDPAPPPSSMRGCGTSCPTASWPPRCP